MTEEYLDLTEEKLERKRNGQLDFDADLIMANGAGKTKLRATDFRCENLPQPKEHPDKDCCCADSNL